MMPERKITEKHHALLEPVPTDGLDDVRGWLEAQAAEYNLKCLLAHADDGVIWGRVNDDKTLVTSDSAFSQVSPPLRLETLQTARLFSKEAELLLWRDGDNKWHARLIKDAAKPEEALWRDSLDEPHILWGTDPGSSVDNFTLMSDGAQGLCHAVPLVVNPPVGKKGFDEQSRPLRLWVRHYVQEDDNGFLRIVASRLTKLTLDMTLL